MSEWNGRVGMVPRRKTIDEPRARCEGRTRAAGPGERSARAVSSLAAVGLVPVVIFFLAALSGCLPGMPARSVGGPTFEQAPVAEFVDGEVRIRFVPNELSDVTVLIRNEAGETVRHLAAGVLGENAPEPFSRGSRAQTVVWDGTNDAGERVGPGKYTAVVALGTEATYDRTIGYQPDWIGNINAMVADSDGTLYVAAGAGVVVLNRDGEYVRQIAPAPDDMPAEELAGREPVRMPDGTVHFQRDYNLPGGNVGSMAMTPDGMLLIPGGPGDARKLTRLSTDGRVPAGALDTQMLKLSDAGLLFVAASPDGKTLYISAAEAGYLGHDARRVIFRQAVYRLRLDSDGPAEIFTGDDENRGGPGFSVNRPKGLATDPEGNLYVCNHGGNNIAVYTPGAGLIRSIQVERPQQVAVHPETGHLYVLAGSEEGYRRGIHDYAPTMKEARLMRFSPDGELEFETEIEDTFERTGSIRPGPSYRLSMASDFSGDRPVIWLGVSNPNVLWSRWRLLRIEDEGDRFGEHRDVYPRPDEGVMTQPLQVFLEPESDRLYVNDWNRLMVYSGDGSSQSYIRLVSPDVGERYYICEAVLGPDNHIYALTWDGRWSGWTKTHLRRFNLEGHQVPFEGGRMESDLIVRTMKGASGTSSRGMTVDAEGNIYVMHYDRERPPETRARWERGWPYGTAIAVFGPDGEMKDRHHVAYLRAGAQGVRVDRQGNLYVGESILPLGVTYPRDFAEALPDPLDRPYPAMTEDGSFDPLLRWQGSIIQFGPGGGRIDGLPGDAEVGAPPARPDGDLWKPMPEFMWHLHNNHKLRVEGARWMRHGVFSPLPAQYQGVTHAERCVCGGGRFDMDEFGRLLVPDRIRSRVSILDSAGNIVAQFGRRGNRDSVSDGADIALANPWWIAGSTDRVYVGERNPNRILRVQLSPRAEASTEFEIP